MKLYIFFILYLLFIDMVNSAELGLGLGGNVKSKEYIGISDENNLFPIIYYSNELITISGPLLDVHLYETKLLSTSFRTRLGFSDGYEAIESPVLTGMRNKKNSVWFGSNIAYKTKYGTFDAEILFDLSNNSNGIQSSFYYRKKIKISSNVIMEPSIFVTWLSDDYVDYYYGVTSDEATLYRASYKGGKTVNTGVELNVGYNFNQSQQLVLIANYTNLGNSITDSPIVEKASTSSISVLYVYLF